MNSMCETLTAKRARGFNDFSNEWISERIIYPAKSKRDYYKVIVLDEFNELLLDQTQTTKSVIDRLWSLAKLKENWDGYGASPINQNAILNSISFLDLIPTSFNKMIDEDTITPTPYGTIVFDWENDKGILSVEIGNTTMGFFTDFKSEPNIRINSTPYTKNELPIELEAAFKILS
jgi:hypothetical protein